MGKKSSDSPVLGADETVTFRERIISLAGAYMVKWYIEVSVWVLDVLMPIVIASIAFLVNITIEVYLCLCMCT